MCNIVIILILLKGYYKVVNLLEDQNALYQLICYYLSRSLPGARLFYTVYCHHK